MKRLFVFLIVISSCSMLNAAINFVCKVQYETRLGWSDAVKAEVTFATGSELNTATRSYNFISYKIYATIWFSENECAIIELNNHLLGIGGSVTYSNVDSLFTLRTYTEGEQVNTNYKICWKITAKDFMGYIDERL